MVHIGAIFHSKLLIPEATFASTRAKVTFLSFRGAIPRSSAALLRVRASTRGALAVDVDGSFGAGAAKRVMRNITKLPYIIILIIKS